VPFFLSTVRQGEGAEGAYQLAIFSSMPEARIAAPRNH
jgi:hypothetical protein